LLPPRFASGPGAQAGTALDPKTIKPKESIMRKTIYETNYDRLIKLGIIAKYGSILIQQGKSCRSGLMDCVVERIQPMDSASGNSGIALSLAHYFLQNGDRCKDPEMVIIVYPALKMAEALTFEQSLPPIYQVVFPEPDKFYPQLKKELNGFLRLWLNNLIDQGHGKHWVLDDK
jgi:hypothetical protein